MTLAVQFLNCSVVGVFVGDKECTANLATVRVVAISVKYLFIKVDVINVDGTVEGDRYHLRYLVGFDAARNAGTVSRAETVWQCTLVSVAIGRSVRVHVDSCKMFI